MYSDKVLMKFNVHMKRKKYLLVQEEKYFFKLVTDI